LLAHALKHNSFVGFKNMEPSLVKLDTTYQVQLAYAEAASAIDFIMHRLGATGLVHLLQDLQRSQEEGAAAAIARVMGLEFAQFQDQWRQFLAAKKLQEYDGIRLPRFELKEEGKLPQDDVHKELQSTTARMHARLGDRLRQRGHDQAAAVEYGRALEKDPHSPYLLNKLAASFMAQGRWPEALPSLQRAELLDPDYVTTHTNLGRLHVALRAYDEARQALWEALQINPFDPSIHVHLAESYRQLGQTDKAQQEQQLFERLQEKQ
jgi:tetratricopeptide (TPR) repeat protein